MKFIDDNGNEHSKVWIDGYDITGRQLEGVKIIIEFDNKDNLVASFLDEDSDYLNQFNTDKFLKMAVDHVEDIIDEGDYEMLTSVDGNVSIASIEGHTPDMSNKREPVAIEVESTNLFDLLKSKGFK